MQFSSSEVSRTGSFPLRTLRPLREATFISLNNNGLLN
jgi:hypothetical protein